MIKNIIFDLGGVLVDWNPLHLYRKLFKTEAEAVWFVDNICNLDWNEEQDAGRSIAEGERLLIQQFPEWEFQIRIYHTRWEEMFKGAIEGTVSILKELLYNNDYRIVGLTNWSAETFPKARTMFEFFDWFEGIVVSGEEGMRKPDHKIYQLLIDRFDFKVEECVFIDDNLRNIEAAQAFGLKSIHFKEPESLRLTMIEMGILNE